MLAGKWQKLTTEQCSQTYPDDLEFFERGIYTGTQRNPRADFTWWDAGSYEVITDRQVKLSTANDAVKTYQFSITEDVLTFVDQEGCTFQYRRIE